MTVRELIELNNMICDIQIRVRKDHALVNELNIGLGMYKPPYPTRIPQDENDVVVAKNAMYMDSRLKDAPYIDKSINAFDDGKDYYQIKLNRIPAKWLDLQVDSWEVWSAKSIIGRRGNTNFHGERINITCLPSGESLRIHEPRRNTEQVEGQLNLLDWDINIKTL